MKIGVAVPYYEQYADYGTVLSIAAQAEELGFDVVWFADHVALPGYDVPRMGGRWFEVLTLMSNLAAHVKTIGLGTDVLVLPHRNPILSAKMLTTLDIVSAGRLIIGVGGGYVPEEIEALGTPYRERGAFTDECLRVWKELWGPGNANFQGRFLSFSDITADPKPVQQPHPPIWVGNRGPRVLRRVAELGDGWHPVGLTFEELEDGLSKLRALWRENGRSVEPALCFSGLYGSVGDDAAPEKRKGLLTGSVSQVIEDLERLKAMGCVSVIFRLGIQEGTPERVSQQMKLIAERILPKVR